MGFIYFGNYIIEFIYGEKFEGSHKYLIFLSGAMFAICLSKILCDILIGQKKFGFIKYQILSYCFFIYLMTNHFTELGRSRQEMFFATSVFLLIFTMFFAINNYYTKKKFAIHKH
jgi:O-antigen/teichoic acid export membrane protein